MESPGSWWWAITAESFLDRLTEVPDVLALTPQVKCPILALRGDREDAYRYPAEEVRSLATAPCKCEIVSDCDHFYNGREERVAGIVTGWLQRTLGV